MKSLFRGLIRLILASTALSGCVSDLDLRHTEADAQRVQASTVLPRRFKAGIGDGDLGDLIVAPYVLMTSKVVRPRAEIRVGPGSQFELLEGSLSQNAEVVVLSQHGNWFKTIPIHDGPAGWVHQQTLSRARLNTHSIHLRTMRLPVVQVAHDTDRVWLYGKNKLVTARVPRGTIFRSLRLTEQGALVWIPETGSVVWLSRKDVM